MDSIIEKLVDLINNFDPISYLPDVTSVLNWAELYARICVLAAPVILLIFGLSWLLLPAKEANHTAGYRFYFGMGSVAAWRFTQKLAGIVWSVLGLILGLTVFFVSRGFGAMELMDMVDQAAKCILWEIILALLSCLAINLTLIIRYDRHGQVRWDK